MALLRQVTGSAWPTSGAASAATTGLDTITGGTHVGSTDVPAGSLATGFIQGTDGGALSVRIDPTTATFQANETDVWATVCWRFMRTATDLPADATALQFNIVQNAGTRLRSYLYVKTSTNNPGLGITVTEFLTGGTEEKLHSVGSSGSGAVIPFDTFAHLTMHWSRSTAGGIYELFYQGHLIMRQSGLPTDGDVTAAQLRAQCNMTWPATSGIRAEIHAASGGITSYDGVGPTLRPMHSEFAATALIAQAHNVDCSLDQASTSGKSWAYTGGATRTLVAYATTGVNPARKRWLYAGTAQSWNQTLIDAIGAPAYGETGVMSLILPMIYVPDGTAQIVIRNAAASAILTLDITGGNLMQGATTLAPWTVGHRYALGIHLSDTGQAKFSLSSLTGDNTARNAWSGDLGGWTPGNLGTATISGVTGSATAECDGLRVYRLPPYNLADSLCHAYSATVSPQMSTSNNIAEAYATSNDIVILPNAAYPNRVWGLPQQPTAITIGRSGQTRNAVQVHCLNHLTEALGILYVNYDGGSVNDFNASAMTNEAQQTAILDGMQTNLETHFDQARDQKSIVLATTMLTREAGSFAWTALQIAAFGLFTARIRASITARQSARQHIWLADVALAIADHLALFTPATDSIHPNTAGNGTVAKAMSQNLTVPASPGGASRPFLSLGQSVLHSLQKALY